MTCEHCQSANSHDEHRCLRCGRRLTATASLYADRYASVGVERAPEPHPVAQVRAVSYDDFARRRAQARLAQTESRYFLASDTLLQRLDESGMRLAPIEFVVPALPGRKAEPTLSSESVIACEYRTASAMHRALAAALDTSMVLMGVGLFLSVLLIAGIEIVLNAHTIPMYAGVVLIVGLLYNALWSIAGADTLGRRATRLKLMTLEGEQPTVRHRMVRTGSQFLSVSAAGLGLAWSVVDEDKLTWHDHMSGTFLVSRSSKLRIKN